MCGHTSYKLDSLQQGLGTVITIYTQLHRVINIRHEADTPQLESISFKPFKCVKIRVKYMVRYNHNKPLDRVPTGKTQCVHCTSVQFNVYIISTRLLNLF